MGGRYHSFQSDNSRLNNQLAWQRQQELIVSTIGKDLVVLPDVVTKILERQIYTSVPDNPATDRMGDDLAYLGPSPPPQTP